jgi:hypothetical protein
MVRHKNLSKSIVQETLHRAPADLKALDDAQNVYSQYVCIYCLRAVETLELLVSESNLATKLA